MRASFLSLLSLCCFLMVAGCGAAQAQPAATTTATSSPTAAVAATPTEGLAPTSPWRKLWALPALPPPRTGALPPIPQIAWSPTNVQRLYLCRVTPADSGESTLLHNLYRSDDQGQHWTAYPLPEAAASCRVEVDPTNADALVLLDGMYHTYVSRDGGQSWQQVPDPPHWNAHLLVAPAVQIMAGRLYAESYWTDDLTHWTRWYPVADEQQHVYVQINPQHSQTLYTSVEFSEFRCAGAPSVTQLAGSPLTHLAQLCRSDDGGQTWRFLAVVDVENNSNALGIWTQGNIPNVCLVLNHPTTLYALGYTTPDNAPLQPAGFGGPMRSTDGGNTWTRLPAIFTGNDEANLFCGVDDYTGEGPAYAGQSPIMVDPYDSTGQANEWGAFGITADGTIYHVADTTGTRGGVTMTKGVSLLTDTGWKVIAPYPDGVTTPFTSKRLRVLLMTPPSGAPVLLAFTDQNVYSYTNLSI